MRTIPVLLVSVAAFGAAACLVRHTDARAQQAPVPAPAADAPSQDTLRDVEVMRRVLVREGLGTQVSAAFQYLRFVYDGSAVAAGTSEAYLVRGDGATFVLRTSDPVAPPADTSRNTEEQTKPSAWDEAEAELDGRPRRAVTWTAMKTLSKYDAAKVESLRTRLIEQLANFGGRIRGLEASDHLTVVVNGGTSSDLVFNRTASNDAGTTKDVKGALLDLAVGAPPLPQRSTVLTLRVSVADCRAYSSGALDLNAFRARVVTAAY